MSGCDFCGKPFESFPHRCKYCGQLHCSDHLIPESHDCLGLRARQESNAERWKEGISKSIHHHQPIKEYSEPETKKTKKNHLRKQNTLEKIKTYFSYQYEDFKDWLKRREHYRYHFEGRSNYLITTILIFIASLVGISIFYSNAQKLNQINLWIIKLGGVLILTSLFFAIKYGWRLLKEALNILKRQRNWLRYIIIILVIILLWQTFIHRNTVLNPVFESYNKTNFSLLMPIGIKNFSLQDKSVSYDYNDRTGNQKTGNIKADYPLKPTIDISSLESEIHDLINQERQNNGLKTLSFDSKLSDIARAHSQDMATNNYFEHENLRGQDPTDRANMVGYRCHKDYGSYYTDGIAENIFQNNLYDSVTYVNLVPFHEWNTQSEIAQSTVQGWMNSPGHRKNILTSDYDKEGIGVAISNDDKVYITEDFC